MSNKKFILRNGGGIENSSSVFFFFFVFIFGITLISSAQAVTILANPSAGVIINPFGVKVSAGNGSNTYINQTIINGSSFNATYANFNTSTGLIEYYVPYVGAKFNVHLGEKNLTAGSAIFNESIGTIDASLGYPNVRLGTEPSTSGRATFEFYNGVLNSVWSIDNGGNSIRFFNGSIVYGVVNKSGFATDYDFCINGGACLSKVNSSLNNSFVPYIGALKSVDLGINNLSARNVSVNDSLSFGDSYSATEIRNLMYFAGGPYGNASQDGFRMDWNPAFEAANDDWLLFMKTDANDIVPDGGIGFGFVNGSGNNGTVLRIYFDGNRIDSALNFNLTNHNLTDADWLFGKINWSNVQNFPGFTNDSYVPYNGAIHNLNLGDDNNISAGNIKLNNSIENDTQAEGYGNVRIGIDDNRGGKIILEFFDGIVNTVWDIFNSGDGIIIGNGSETYGIVNKTGFVTNYDFCISGSKCLSQTLNGTANSTLDSLFLSTGVFNSTYNATYHSVFLSTNVFNSTFNATYAAYNTSTGLKAYYVMRTGDNITGNYNISTGNITADYISANQFLMGQPLTGMLGGGLIQSTEGVDFISGVNLTCAGLVCKYNSFEVRLASITSATPAIYCNITNGSFAGDTKSI